MTKIEMEASFNERIDRNFPNASKAQKKVIFDMLNDSIVMIVRAYYPTGIQCYFANKNGGRICRMYSTKVNEATLKAMQVKGILIQGQTLWGSLNRATAITKHTFTLAKLKL